MPQFCKSSSRTLTRCPNNIKPSVVKKSGIKKMKRTVKPKSFNDHFSDWVDSNKDLGVLESKLYLPFLVGAPKLAECRGCENVIYPGEEASCSVLVCKVSYHSRCACDRFGVTELSKDIKCPQHVCHAFFAKRNLPNHHFWRCLRCDLASHDKCAAFPAYVLHSNERPGNIMYWRHSTDSPPLKHAFPTGSIEEAFCCLPLPYVAEEFKIDLTWRDTMKDYLEPPSYAPPAAPISSIKLRLLTRKFFAISPFRMWKWNSTWSHLPMCISSAIDKYLTKEKRYDMDENIGCTSVAYGICNEDCECRCLYFSCSSACECAEKCTNRPFQEGKKVKVVTRFRNMKQKGSSNSYVVEVRKDFNIDAIFNGNESRFVNHSCDPNCTMEQWDVNGKTRLGIFAAKSIKPGAELTFDYRYEQFGSEVECHRGASNCHGYLGTKKRDMVDHWGAKRLRAISN